MLVIFIFTNGSSITVNNVNTLENVFDVSVFMVILSTQMACIVLFWKRKPDENCYIVNLLLILNIFLHCLDYTSCHAVFFILASAVKSTITADK